VKALEFGPTALDALELRPQIVEEEGADYFEDVTLAGVVSADLPPLLWLHDGLKERAEDGGRDARPIEPGAGEKGITHVAVKVGEPEFLRRTVRRPTPRERRPKPRRRFFWRFSSGRVQHN